MEGGVLGVGASGAGKWRKAASGLAKATPDDWRCEEAMYGQTGVEVCFGAVISYMDRGWLAPGPPVAPVAKAE